MNKNTVIGLLLMALVLIVFSYINTPSDEEREAQRIQDSIAYASQKAAEEQAEIARIQAEAAAQQAALTDTSALFFGSLTGQNTQVTLRSEKIEVTINSKGGTPVKAKVLGFTDRSGDPDVTIFDEGDHSLNFMLLGKATNIVTEDLFFTPTNISDSTVTMTAQAAGGGSVRIDYKLHDGYLLRAELSTQGLSGIFAPNYRQMDIEWSDACRQQERGFTFENRYATLTYKEAGGGTDYLSETKEKKDEKIDEALDWIAFKNQFFSVVLIPKDGYSSDALLTSIPQEKGSGYLKNYEAKMKTSFDPTGSVPTEFEMYIGPNDFRLLQRVEKAVGYDKDLKLQRLVYLGWPLFRIINRWFTLYVFDWLTGLGLNMGIVLILITLLLKCITFPMVKKTYLNSAKMRVLKPKLDEATKQYDKPEDQMMKQQAMMALYSKYGVSPLSGCLPMLIQMPIWIAMFNFVPNAIQLRGQSFLWIDDLSTYDPIIEWNTNIWLIGDHLSLTCILFCVSNVLYSWMTMRQQKDQMVGQQADQMKMMMWMMYLMPVIFFFMFNDYSSGLNFYYFISLFFSAAIMWTLRKTTNDEKLLAKLEAKYRENERNPKKATGMAARLEAMQKQAAELQRQRQQQGKR